MKLSIRYLDTCLPDYFNGFPGDTFAVSLPPRPRNGDVLQGLKAEINAYDATNLRPQALAISNAAAGMIEGLLEGSTAYDQLYESTRELFDGMDLRKRWSQHDDLGDCYAYFGVVIEDPETPAVAHLYAKKVDGKYWRLYWSVPGSTTCVGAEGECSYTPYRTLWQAIAGGKQLYRETAKKANW
jgi:hypothetical protein